MFDLSWSHILIVLIVALVVVGPKDLPRLMRMAGGWVAKARGMANDFRRSFDEMAKQTELDELRAEIDALRRERPLADVEDTLHRNILPPDDLPPAEAGVKAAAETPADTAAQDIPEPVHQPGDVPPAP
ncbi:MAG TPA: Sec-independent protein translocase protein TatB [Rhizomicrobium sp.]|jgi:sec-independent protein translocase protein TatB